MRSNTEKNLIDYDKCPVCDSSNLMEREGICHDYHDFVCLDCGHKWRLKLSLDTGNKE